MLTSFPTSTNWWFLNHLWSISNKEHQCREALNRVSTSNWVSCCLNFSINRLIESCVKVTLLIIECSDIHWSAFSLAWITIISRVQNGYKQSQINALQCHGIVELLELVFKNTPGHDNGIERINLSCNQHSDGQNDFIFLQEKHNWDFAHKTIEINDAKYGCFAILPPQEVSWRPPATGA